MKTILTTIKLSCILLVFYLASGCTEEAEKSTPELLGIGLAAPDVLVLTVQARWVGHGVQVPYEQPEGDSIRIQGQHRYIIRNGQAIGCLVGIEGKVMQTLDRIYGDTLDVVSAGQKESYQLNAMDENKRVEVSDVFRKTKPVDCVRSPMPAVYPLVHTLMLKLSEPLVPGEVYTLNFKEGMLSQSTAKFVYDPASLRSEAVHVNQVGFRPDDPVKLVFLSFWMGDGGNLSYPDGINFHLLKNGSGEVAFSGQAKLSKAATDEGNRTMADIHTLDFSGFNEPGTYRISVEGVGCSFPFEISETAWKDAFVKSMRGLYCQRSGIALGPPYTNFVRPRGFHPEDGIKVYISEPVREGEDSTIRIKTPEQQLVLATFTPGKANFKRLVDDLTNQVLPNAWGGYMDAGDWDRRPDHALLPMFLFDLAEMLPKEKLEWTFNIMDSADSIPDLVNEALWEVDFLRRMQQPDGSVFGGIESGEHPRRGECSWQESLPIMAYSRTKGTAYNYAAIGARAALWFHLNGYPDVAEGYRESILRAFEWAEQQPATDRDRGPDAARCIAAAELYRLTGEDKYHKIFLSLTRFNNPDAPFYLGTAGANNDPQGEAGWTYLRTTHTDVNRDVQNNILKALIREADRDILLCEETDFHWSGGKAKNLWWGALSSPGSHVLCRAHFLTGREDYLKAIVKTALTGAGANPVNMCYVTGVGSQWPQHALHEDAYNTNQPLYEGITIGGPIDPTVSRHVNSAKVMSNLYPEPKNWPATESYYDVFMYVPMNEFTVHQTMQSTSFVWGYLAGRK
jgi:endoglucanase